MTGMNTVNMIGGMTATDREITGYLENWRYDVMNHVIWGNLVGDIRKRWPEGSYIHTSNLRISKADAKQLADGDTVNTLNSTYVLGSKKESNND